MSFRTVVVTDQAKISYKNRFLVVKKDLDEKYIHLSEIDTVIVDSISVSISSYLLKELAVNKINIIFCDEKHHPFGELQNYYGSHNTSKKVIQQSKWTIQKKNQLWMQIVQNKILNQAQVLKITKTNQWQLVYSYIDEVTIGDKTNREGHAAKVYFNALFGKTFERNHNDSINSALNYGYAILLSTINKEIISNGFLTQLGIHHKSEFNEFNLSCDLMEVFRPVIDHFVYYNQQRSFDQDYKMDLVNLFNHNYRYKNRKYFLKDIISLYVKNTLEYFETGKNYEKFIFEG